MVTKPSRKRRTIRVGSTVRLHWGVEDVTAEVIEDRGPLGDDGEHIYRVRFWFTDVSEPREIEIEASRLQPRSPVEAPERELSVGLRGEVGELLEGAVDRREARASTPEGGATTDVAGEGADMDVTREHPFGSGGRIVKQEIADVGVDGFPVFRVHDPASGAFAFGPWPEVATLRLLVATDSASAKAGRVTYRLHANDGSYEADAALADAVPISPRHVVVEFASVPLDARVTLSVGVVQNRREGRPSSASARVATTACGSQVHAPRPLAGRLKVVRGTA